VTGGRPKEAESLVQDGMEGPIEASDPDAETKRRANADRL